MLVALDDKEASLGLKADSVRLKAMECWMTGRAFKPRLWLLVPPQLGGGDARANDRHGYRVFRHDGDQFI